MTVELRVLGSLRLSASDGRDLESLLRQPKRTALLAYLAAAVPRGFQRRDTLLALFWPELDDAHARAALNQALYVLRNALGEQAVVTRGADEVGLNHDTIWCDAVRFENAIDGGRPDEALGLYGGDLLEGFFLAEAGAFERWLETERARLRQRASEGAWMLAEKAAAERDAVGATRWARRAADLLPADEAVIRRLMTFLDRLGDRAAAIRAYEAFAWRLNADYELEPSAQTQALAVAMREQGRHPADVRFVKLRSVPAILVAIQQRVPMRAAVVGFVVAIGLVAAVGAWLSRRAPVERPVMRFALQFPGFELVGGGVAGSTIALSPDGRRLVYLALHDGRRELYSRALDQLSSTPIRDTKGSYLPFFSPDGEWLAFVADGAIRKVAFAGGSVRAICDVAGPVFGASWGSDDVIVFATAAGLWRVAAAGGTPTALTASDTARGTLYRWPETAPGARAALVTKVDATGFQLATVSLETGVVRSLGVEGTSPHFVAPGYLVFARTDGSLFAAPFDAGAQRITGPVQLVAEGVAVGVHGAAKLGVSRDGALAFRPERFADRALVLVDRAGRLEMLPLPLQGYHAARFSRDGRRIALTILESAARQNVWAFDLERRTLEQVTFDTSGASPYWSPDGARVAFTTAGAGRESGFAVQWIAATGTDTAETLLAPEHGQHALGFTPDGRALLVGRTHPETHRDLWVLRIAGERRLEPFLRTSHDEGAGTLSPDGRWVAYVSNESGRDEVYVRAFPVPGAAVRISVDGGREPRWGPQSDEVFYRAKAGLIAARVATTSPLAVTQRDVLFDDRRFLAVSGGSAYDVHPDGHRFVMIRRGPESAELVVLLNWFDGLPSRR